MGPRRRCGSCNSGTAGFSVVESAIWWMLKSPPHEGMPTSQAQLSLVWSGRSVQDAADAEDSRVELYQNGYFQQPAGQAH
ncbi:hypothetical protein VTK56DRAFT_1622 [Thermocarpiscus australiensis]